METVIERAFGDLLSEKYLAYALSTITSRSLPDVRDGMKPVHRRLLYAMSQLNLGPNTSPKKSARVVGDVIGKYHPHGDTAVYDAMVRLAQDFAQRYPMVDGQGNFGNIDGDNAAAMRYTEARLTRVAELMLEGIDEDAVDFRETYDGEGKEPIVLPAAFPNLLANGASGIAVGMATNIPPFNVAELCNALVALIKNRNLSFEALHEMIPGPDFPTGGTLVEDAHNVVQAYATGRGGFRLRAKWEVEPLGNGQYQIVVTEIPYQVQKAKLIERIADLMQERKLPLLDDVRDESTEDVRVVLVPRSRNVEAELLMESLFRNTDLENRFSLNMNVLEDGRVPRVMNIREVLLSFLDHRHEVLIRRTNHRLEKIAHRLEVLGGYLVAYLNLDEVIRIIREEDDAKASLIKAFDLTEVQADAILNMRLRALRKLEEMEIRKEYDALSAEQTDLRDLLEKPARRWKVIGTQIKQVGKEFGQDTALGARRTVIGEAPTLDDVPVEAMVEREPVTVVCSAKGWIRAVKGHINNAADLRFKEGDRARFALHAETTDRLVIFGTNGRFYTIGVDKLPPGRGYGEPVRLMVDLPNDADIVSMAPHDPERQLILAASDGRGFRVAEKDVIAQTKNGKQVMNVSGATEAAVCLPIAEGADHVVVVGTNRKLLIFPLDELPELARGRGVILQRYKDGRLADITTMKAEDGLQWKRGDGVRTETEYMAWMGKRGQAGRMVPTGFPRSNKFS
ncbi:MAG: DNA topoisomerase IV subunit A [Pseudomonadota bacterium]